MNPLALPPVAAVLRLVHDLVVALADAITPVSGGLAAAAAVVLLTLAVRLLLVPLGVAQVRADLGRRRLAPRVAALRRRHRDRPEVLQRELLRLHRDEGVSPAAGCLPALAQSPVLMVVYGVFSQASIAGAPNLLLHHALAGTGLGQSLASVVLAGSLGPGAALLFGLLLAVVAVATAWTVRASAGDGSLRLLLWIAPVLATGFACVAPLAAVLYLATSATWTLAERTAVRRVLLTRASVRPAG